ncbi:uncharacterized protein LOC126973743, partial [Leptidea sinapis]|uniref:uncharacterized protein LOC126973743 n=1 Tax=Leptidea sinapis TaxID=189913 RepID=UPI0021C38924
PPPPRGPKSVTFCTHRRDYYSDPGHPKTRRRQKKKQPADPLDDVRYYSEPDAKYFEIDYEFLKQLRQIARSNCPKCRRKRTRRDDRSRRDYVMCRGRYHSRREHCRFCCRICNRSTDTLDSIDDDYSLVSKSSSFPARGPRSKTASMSRKSSIQSIKSVSFLESSSESMKVEPNYTAKSFTNDLKKFLLKPSSPRLSLREKLINSFKQELEATRKSPKLKAIKGLWKSY